MSENLWFSNVFRVDRNGTLGGNGLTNFVMVSLMRLSEALRSSSQKKNLGRKYFLYIEAWKKLYNEKQSSGDIL